MPNGFCALGGVLFLLAIYAFFRITTEQERWRWGRNIAGVFVVLLIVVTIFDYIGFIGQQLR